MTNLAARVVRSFDGPGHTYLYETLTAPPAGDGTIGDRAECWGGSTVTYFKKLSEDAWTALTAAGDVTASGVATLTNKRITKRVLATSAPGATPTINTDNYDVVNLTGVATAITNMTTNLTGTPVAGDTLRIALTDDGTARTITWGTKFESSAYASLPGTTTISTRMDVGFVWNTATSKWRCVGWS